MPFAEPGKRNATNYRRILGTPISGGSTTTGSGGGSGSAVVAQYQSNAVQILTFAPKAEYFEALNAQTPISPSAQVTSTVPFTFTHSLVDAQLYAYRIEVEFVGDVNIVGIVLAGLVRRSTNLYDGEFTAGALQLDATHFRTAVEGEVLLQQNDEFLVEFRGYNIGSASHQITIENVAIALLK